MKRLGFLAVAVFATAGGVGLPSAAGQKDGADAKELEKFQGKWATAAVTVDGKKEDEDKDRFLVIKDAKATFLYKDSERGSGSIKVDPGKSPGHIDFTYEDGPAKGTTLKGIYKFEKETLTVCYGGIGKDRPTEFASKAGSESILVVQKKAK
jgi:uncharacterized protein (TIGR03067 family)